MQIPNQSQRRLTSETEGFRDDRCYDENAGAGKGRLRQTLTVYSLMQADAFERAAKNYDVSVE